MSELSQSSLQGNEGKFTLEELRSDFDTIQNEITAGKIGELATREVGRSGDVTIFEVEDTEQPQSENNLKADTQEDLDTGVAEPAEQQDSAESVSVNEEIERANTEAVENFINREEFEELKITHQAIVEGYAGAIRSRAIQARNGMLGTTEAITRLNNLFDMYGVEDLNFVENRNAPKRLLNEIAENIQTLEATVSDIVDPSMVQPQSGELIQGITEGVHEALPVINENKEPDNEWLHSFTQVGHDFGNAVDYMDKSMGQLQKVMPAVGGNVRALVGATLSLLDTGNITYDTKMSIRQNLEGLQQALQVVRPDINGLPEDSEHLQIATSKLLSLVGEKKTA